jgi:hypothetical protein
MFSFRLFAITGVAVLLASPPASAETLPARLRGTITAIDEAGITLNERDGRTFKLGTLPSTAYANVVPASLDAIRVNDYIGSAVKGPRDHLIAVEIVLVPESMRAGRVGYYAWDPLPDTSGIQASGVTETTMTNGLVSGVSTMTSVLRGTVATDGIADASHGDAAARNLTVNLVGDRPANILVSSTAPIVRFVPADRTAVSVGAVVVVWTQPGNLARLVAVGKGVTPPM